MGSRSSCRRRMAEHGDEGEAMLLERARLGDPDAFQRLAEPHRAEVQLHCYRMLGSIHDAEDLVQETFLRAWRSVARFEARTSFRRWLYRIATNACLSVLASRTHVHRVLSDTQASPSEQMPDHEPPVDIAWLEPYPDAALAGVPDAAPGPDARYELRETVRLAFIAAIQLLPPRQRAVLLLRDVLGWSAADAAELLDASVASVNSALQRARTLLGERIPAGRPRIVSEPSDQQQRLLERYMQSWERSDVHAFVALLRDDVVLTMPPWRQWFRGRDMVGRVFAWTGRPGGNGPFRLMATAANGQPAFAFYSRFQGSEWKAHSIQLVEIDGDAIAGMTSFVMPRLFSSFGLPTTLPDETHVD
jgi:RNA polymerase sigma-70 factor, ECF subfamily